MTARRQPDLAPAERLGPFVLQRKLRSGRRSEVWSAGHVSETGRLVALEVSKAVTEADRARFEQTKLALAARRPIGLVPVLAVREEGGRQFAVLERSDAPSLAEALESNPALPAGAVFAVARDVARAWIDILDAGGVVWTLDPSDAWLGPRGRIRLGGFEIDRPPLTGPPLAAQLSDWVIGHLDPARLRDVEVLQALAQARDPTAEPREALLALSRALEEKADSRSLRTWWSRSEAGQAADPFADFDPAFSPTLPEGGDPTFPDGVELPFEHTPRTVDLGDFGTLDMAEEATLAGDDPQPSSAIEPPTLHDQETSDAPTWNGVLEGPMPSDHLPFLESATEIDEPRLEDAASVAVLDAFRPLATDLQLDEATPSGDPTPERATPSDRLARFDALRMPSRSEIDEAVRGVPTMALDLESTARGRREVGASDPRASGATAPAPSFGPSVTAIVERSRAPDPAGSIPERARAEQASPRAPRERPAPRPPRSPNPVAYHPRPSGRETRSGPPRPPAPPPSRDGWLLPILALILAVAAAALGVILYMKGN